MARRYDDHPLGELSDEQLDQILENYISSYSAETHKNIVRKAKLKKKDPIVQVTFTKRKLLMVAVLLLFFIPVGTYVAAKLWEINVEKKGYELTTKIDKPANQQPDTGHYRLVAEYVPDYLITDKELKGLFFYEDLELDSEKEDNSERPVKARAVKFTLRKLNEKNMVIDEYVKNYKKLKLTNQTAYIITKTDGLGYESGTLARKFFEKQNMFVEMDTEGDISEKEIEKILDNLHLVNVATEEEATEAVDYMTSEEYIKRIIGETIIQGPWTLDLNDKSKVVQLNEAIETVNIDGVPMEEVTVVEVTLSDKIPPKVLSHLKERINVKRNFDPANIVWDEKGNLEPFMATRYLLGDGKGALNEKIEDIKIVPKYLEIELTIKNHTENAKELIFFSPVKKLDRQGSTATYLSSDTMLIQETPSNIYTPYRQIYDFYDPILTSTGGNYEDGFSGGERQSLAPGETATVTASYVLSYEDYDNLFLDLNYVISGVERFIQLTQ